MTKAQITAEALVLPREDQASLVDDLLCNLAENQPHPHHDQWMQVVNRRIADMDSGKVAEIPGEKGLKMVRDRLRR
jgi:putative addiction module component (TIGR02574 family)